MLKSELKDTVNYYVQGAINLIEAKYSEIKDGEVSIEVQEFRKNQCLTCPLFNKINNTCNNQYLSDGKSLVSIDRIHSGELPKIEVNGVIRQTIVNNVVFTRGCGCTLWNNEPQKIKYHFREELLELKDGTAPCPLNRWTKEQFYARKNNTDIES